MEVNTFDRPPETLVEGFRSIGTSTIGDILDEMGIQGVATGLRAVVEGSRLVGPAVTVKETSGTVGTYTIADFPVSRVIDHAQAGDVIVFDNGGREISTWGGLASTAAKTKGIEGVVVDGGCRDADEIAAVNFPIFSRYITPITGKTRIKILEMNGTIQCSGIRVRPGDIIVADRTGVVVVPQERAQEVLEKAMEAEKDEDHFAAELKKGTTFTEMQRRTGRL
jgi:regulator of RNase E activity RraA